MYNTLSEIERDIEKQRQHLAELETVKKNMLEDVQTSSEAGQLAIDLHKKLCNWDHTEGCSWYYEIRDGIHDWRGSEHSRWFSKAQTLLAAGHSRETVMQIINIAK